ncbi:DNA cytosine methyltransferase [Micromonospora lupini]|uniref:DNA cytosine methyltransferase n=1 Tax=Micromonospora lupini TaxID=285679 RepID=UPI002258617A|nr:DNA cytosine methyltransferase [Micromonospora lupini]MCX5068756.1 DNA cytosine methyltransferase [Micromonospora lupini]
MSRGPQPSRDVVSLFSGAGGLDLGLEWAGWNIAAQVEMDPDCVGTLQRQAKNRERPTKVLDRRLEDIDPVQLRDELGFRPGELPLLAGGPPCQPFTTSGRRQGLSDARATTLFPAYLTWVDAFDPQFLLIENVDGMLSAALQHRPLVERGPRWPLDAPLEERKGSFLKWLLDQLGLRGYAVSWGVAEAADYGVPQMRQRSVLIATKGAVPCWLPRPTFGTANQPFKTLRQALQGVNDLGPVMPISERKKAVYRNIPPGGNWRHLPDALRRETMGRAYHATGGKSGWWRRLSWELPAPTILGMPDHSSTALIHPDELRCLSVNECAAVQSFPAGTEFAGGFRSQYQQIGNAVPPLLGKALGAQLLRFAAGEREEEPLVPAWRQSSANRRPGTHGWTLREGYHLHVPIRPDHVWAAYDVETPVDARAKADDTAPIG